MIIVDGSFLGYRSMTKFCWDMGFVSKGRWIPTGTIYSFLKSLIQIREEVGNDEIILAWDSIPTKRKEVSNDYKAHRKSDRSSDPEMSKKRLQMLRQLNELKKILLFTGVNQYFCKGFEADDILATLSKRNRESDHVILVARDKDLFQVLHKNVCIYDFKTVKDLKWFKREFKDIDALDWIAVQALTGDSVDNVKGINGVGVTTAIKLLKKHGSLQKILKQEKWIDKKTRDQVCLAEKLVRLETDLNLVRMRSEYNPDRLNSILMSKRIKSITIRDLVFS